ncbi:uncharacterized protein LOC105423428 [Pogonomyrmex barbatus]|uniref:Uncharacterized protein LOC105423428 n=1 Tax=Pogonomyrmex barbatus TaxID=144034 RepID=A0A6I9VRI6_9HYME|nr:uncharacterized protein LOC105423428 [Pogonomyrmex barbatus]
MKGKAKLRDRSEWIEDDLTEKEKRISWLLKREADRNKREGKQVKVGYMKIWIEEKLWVWDEVKDELKEWQGREMRKEEKGLGWSILNGSIKGDEKGEWTYTGGRGGTVIDYVMGNEETRAKVKMMKVEDWVDSDHQPITVWMEGRGRREERTVKGKRRGRRGVWTEEGKKKFREYVGRKGSGCEGVEEEWKKLKRRIYRNNRSNICIESFDK